MRVRVAGEIRRLLEITPREEGSLKKGKENEQLGEILGWKSTRVRKICWD